MPILKTNPNIEYQRKKDRERKLSTQEDIAKIREVIDSDNIKTMEEIHREIDAKYQAVIRDWGLSMNCYNPNLGFDLYGIHKDELVQNLKMMIAKLEAYIWGNNMITELKKENSQDVNVTVTNTNTNSNEISIEISFEQARQQVENMTSLTDEQTKEILDKITDIENTVNGSGTKKSKWEKLKPILAWLADKSFDVGMTLIPLLLNIQK